MSETRTMGGRGEGEKKGAEKMLHERKIVGFLILLPVMRTRTNYDNFCRFNIFNIHCDTFFSRHIFYVSSHATSECFRLDIAWHSNVQQRLLFPPAAITGSVMLTVL